MDDGGSESEHSSKISTAKNERQKLSVNVTMRCEIFCKLDNLTPGLFDHSGQCNLIRPALFALVGSSVLDPRGIV